MKKQAMIFSILFTLFLLVVRAEAAEPTLADYTAYPKFMAQSVKPNILIILDNSGSMNFNAYGSWPGDYKVVPDEPYTPGKAVNRLREGRDDAEERTYDGANWSDSNDLDLGEFIVALRFSNVRIPQGATIKSAHISFKAIETRSDAASFIIHGEADDFPRQYTTGKHGSFVSSDYHDITGRAETGSSVSWNGVSSWTQNYWYNSADITTIVQEIVNRGGWSTGNTMAFKIEKLSGSGIRRAYGMEGGSNNAPVLHIEYEGEYPEYYGYFNPKSRYSYSSGVFVKDAAGAWDGNFLNWLCMRRVDVLRKVLMGGLATSRQGGGNSTNIGETPAQSSRVYYKWHNGSGVSPYSGGYYYGVNGGYIYIYNSSGSYLGSGHSYTIKVDKSEADEPEDFYQGNLAGVMQRIGDKARWANMWFNTNEGARIANTMDDGVSSNLITDMQNTACDTSTPLAESLYCAISYYRQAAPTGFKQSDTIGSTNDTRDPYYNTDRHVECAKSFVILLTDGASNHDTNIPSTLRDYDGDGNDSTTFDENGTSSTDDDGSDYLDDVALWGRTVDHRSDLDGDQNIILYTIYAFDNTDRARQLLKDAARSGGFIDRDGDNRPDGDYNSAAKDRLEWDLNGDGNPDTYFEASDGYELERQLMAAITDILKRAASGTAASVLATNSEGEGNLIQAFFRPSVTQGIDEFKWLGYLQSLWVDSHGNLREDTVNDYALDIAHDRIIQYYQDEATMDTKVKVFAVSADEPYPDTSTVAPAETKALHEIVPLWEAGKKLAFTSAADRNIFTFVDKDGDGQVDETAASAPWDDSGEVIRFHTANAAALKPYLGVKNGTTWSHLGASYDERVTNVIDYIRGMDINGLRSRTMEIDGTDAVWKLGDIVQSTPVTVSRPPNAYHYVYGDFDYYDYYKANRNRETMVYVGGNDGMLHAFTSWKHNLDNKTFERPSGTVEDIGDEVWAFVPQTLLPHLKWLPDPDYTHVYYVDQMPKVCDAQIKINGQLEWRTILVGGLRMGGKHIWSAADFDSDGSDETRNFYPTYFCLDVTEPRNPRLLWEKTYDGMGFSFETPEVIKVGSGMSTKWYVVFGSGPDSYEGESTQDGHVFVVDLETGSPYQNNSGDDWLFTADAKAFFTSPTAFDKDLESSFDHDVVYFGESYYSGNAWKGKLYRLHTWNSGSPTTTPASWSLDEVFDAGRPITAKPTLTNGYNGNLWIFFGTGRFLGDADKLSTDTEYLFGFKDPLFNEDQSYSSTTSLSRSDLFCADGIKVGTDESVSGATASTWSDFSASMKSEDGWYRTLSLSGERCVTKASVLGGIMLVPSYVPSSDVCEFGGDSYLYALYFETGTAYKEEVFKDGTKTESVDGQEKEVVLDAISLGKGMPAPRFGFHIGNEAGAKAFIQKGTGEVSEHHINTALEFRSSIYSWQED